MNWSDLLKEIIQTYQKFGWTTRRVLLNKNLPDEFYEIRHLIHENIVIENSEVNAVWFSRRSGERETWELRLLSQSPFALIETFEPNIAESERDKIRAQMVEKLRKNLPKFKV